MAAFLRRSATKLVKSYAQRQAIPAAMVAARGMASSKLFVGGLAFHTNETAVRESFEAHGKVLEARVIIDRDTGISRGFAFVTMSTEEEGEAALNAMDGQILNGRVVRVDYATAKSKEPSVWQLGYVPMQEWEAVEKLGYLDDSPPPEAFGPSHTKIAFGPKTLHGGYDYTPAPEVPPYVVDPALTNLPKGNPVYPPGRPVSPPAPLPPYPRSSLSFSDTIRSPRNTPVGLRSSLGLSNGIGQAYPGSTGGPLGDPLAIPSEPFISNNEFSPTPANVRTTPGYAKDTGPQYPKGGYSFRSSSPEDYIGPESKSQLLDPPDCTPSDVAFEPKYAQSGFS